MREVKDLVEFAKVRGVRSLVSEHTIDTEILLGRKTTWLIGKFVQHLGRDSSGVCSQQVLEGLLSLEVAPVADAPKPS